MGPRRAEPAPLRRRNASLALGRALRSRAAGQTAVFVGSSGLVAVLGALAKAVLARELTPSGFGSFAFATAFLAFAGMFFEFGVFLPAARRIARSDPATRREVMGASLLLFIPIGVAFGAAVFALSFVVDGVFHVRAAEPLRLVALLAFVYPFAQVGLQLSQGGDRLHVKSVTSALGQAAFVVSIVVAAWVGLRIDVSLALLLRCAGFLVGTIALVVWLRPVFRRTFVHARVLLADARRWGFQVYVGRILSIGTYNMDVLMVAAFTDAKSVGYYTLAAALADVVGLPVTGLAIALFPRMSRQRELDRRWLTIAWSAGLTAALAVWVTAPPVVHAVFGSSYAAVAALAVPLALAQAVRGATSIYNSFLSAQARGRELRNAGLVLTISNLVLNFALIPPYGAMGAAWASLLALVANLIAHIVSYRRSVRELAMAVG